MAHPARRQVAWLAFAVLGGGCSSPAADGQLGNRNVFPAIEAPFPQVPYRGGGLFASPQIVTVTFEGDSLAVDLEAFGDSITQSQWWTDVTAEYCIPSSTECITAGTESPQPHVVLQSSPEATITSDGTQALITGGIASGQFPAPTPDTLYVLYYPSSSKLETSLADSLFHQGEQCQTIGGFHAALPSAANPTGGGPIAYAIVFECPAGDRFASTLDYVTFSAAHEIVEAATDPGAGETGTGFMLPDSSPWASFAAGGELADLGQIDFLAQPAGATGYLRTASTSTGSYVVPRIWSNSAAKGGGDPNRPQVAGETYFNVAVEQGDSAPTLKKGDVATFKATAFSTAPMSWDVSTVTYDAIGSSPALSVAVSTTSVENGDPLSVTVTVLQEPITDSYYSFAVVSTANEQSHAWPGAILVEGALRCDCDAGQEVSWSTNGRAGALVIALLVLGKRRKTRPTGRPR
jgi:hypothetical protein